jgi:hypothetical protein
MSVRSFDLNIEEVLENWDTEHAIREIISNALDEQTLSGSTAITIEKVEDSSWRIRDYGRGLQIEHFTLNENKEKLSAVAGVIGKFGVGLKDALGTFHRRGVGVTIRSPFGVFRLKQNHKAGFDSIVTLHVEYEDTRQDIRGTEFVLSGVSDSDIDKAKAMFLVFNSEQPLETTSYGQILQRDGATARVYISGVFANDEPNFMCSYNITNLTDSMKKKLNRERLNVGRATYADRIKAILKAAQSESVKELLVGEIAARASGAQHEELAWIEVSQKALTLLNERQNVVFFTESHLHSSPDILDNAKRDGLSVVLVSDHQMEKLENQARVGGPEVRTFGAYVQEYNTSFQYQFVERSHLTSIERAVFDLTSQILALVGIKGSNAPRVQISETIRITGDNTGGVWDISLDSIVIRRDKLRSITEYAAVLLHETAHATTGTIDATRDFENVLTRYLGLTASCGLTR